MQTMRNYMKTVSKIMMQEKFMQFIFASVLHVRRLFIATSRSKIDVSCSINKHMEQYLINSLLRSDDDQIPWCNTSALLQDIFDLIHDSEPHELEPFLFNHANLFTLILEALNARVQAEYALVQSYDPLLQLVTTQLQAVSFLAALPHSLMQSLQALRAQQLMRIITLANSNGNPLLASMFASINREEAAAEAETAVAVEAANVPPVMNFSSSAVEVVDNSALFNNANDLPFAAIALPISDISDNFFDTTSSSLVSSPEPPQVKPPDASMNAEFGQPTILSSKAASNLWYYSLKKGDSVSPLTSRINLNGNGKMLSLYCQDLNIVGMNLCAARSGKVVVTTSAGGCGDASSSLEKRISNCLGFCVNGHLEKGKYYVEAITASKRYKSPKFEVIKGGGTTPVVKRGIEREEDPRAKRIKN